MSLYQINSQSLHYVREGLSATETKFLERLGLTTEEHKHTGLWTRVRNMFSPSRKNSNQPKMDDVTILLAPDGDFQNISMFDDY